MVAVTANYMVLRSLSLASFRPMINETASVIGYALNAEKAGAVVGRRGMAREVIDQTRKNIEERGCVINAISRLRT